MNVPDDLKFAPSHEWFRATDGRVGISDHAQAELSDVVYVDLPQLGRKVSASEVIAVVESVKAASDIYAPIAGEVVAVNDVLKDNPALLNSDPYGEGWLFQIKPDNAETTQLMDADAYKKQIGG